MDSKILSIDEINDRYADRWVIIDQIREDPGPVFRGGRVIFSSVEESSVHQFIKALPDGFKLAVFHIGYPREEMCFAL